MRLWFRNPNLSHQRGTPEGGAELHHLSVTMVKDIQTQSSRWLFHNTPCLKVQQSAHLMKEGGANVIHSVRTLGDFNSIHLFLFICCRLHQKQEAGFSPWADSRFSLLHQTLRLLLAWTRNAKFSKKTFGWDIQVLMCEHFLRCSRVLLCLIILSLWRFDNVSCCVLSCSGNAGVRAAIREEHQSVALHRAESKGKNPDCHVPTGSLVPPHIGGCFLSMWRLLPAGSALIEYWTNDALKGLQPWLAPTPRLFGLCHEKCRHLWA